MKGKIMDFLDNIGKIIQKNIEKENDIKMENDKFERLSSMKNDQGARPLSQEEIELAKKLDAIEEFTIDRFEDNIVVLEDRKNNNMINVKKEELPDNIKEGDILKKINGKYFVDKNLVKETEDRIKKKMDDLWN